MNNRHTLTKSLHTVTAVSRLAREMGKVRADAGLPMPTLETLVRGALDVLGQPSDWSLGDPTMAACITAASKIGAGTI